jgi:hypothetical protein
LSLVPAPAKFQFKHSLGFDSSSTDSGSPVPRGPAR